MSPRFDGFGPQALAFLEGLAVDNTKDYFDAHREVYDEQVAAPMKALVVAVGGALADRVDPNLRAEPKVGRSLFRINRDLRFGADKTPYHTWVDAVFWNGSAPRSSPGFLLRIAPDGIVTGAGVFGLAGERAERYRRAVLDDVTGRELTTIIDDTTGAVRGARLGEPQRARPPRGWPADHPRSHLLRYDALHLSATTPPPASLTSARFASWCTSRLERFAPFERWLVDHVGD